MTPEQEVRREHSFDVRQMLHSYANNRMGLDGSRFRCLFRTADDFAHSSIRREGGLSDLTAWVLSVEMVFDRLPFRRVHILVDVLHNNMRYAEAALKHRVSEYAIKQTVAQMVELVHRTFLDRDLEFTYRSKYYRARAA